MDREAKDANPPSGYRFGPFRLEVAERRLLRDGTPKSLQPRVFDTLVLLVQNAGHLLTKEQLMAALWPYTVVEESNLTKNIWTIRKALGDPDGTAYIETVPRVGYRFVAPVRIELAAAVPYPLPEPAPTKPPLDARPFAEMPAASAEPPAQPGQEPPERLGPYRVLAKLGLRSRAEAAAHWSRSGDRPRR